MTPEIHKKYNDLKTLTDMLVPTLALVDLMGLADFEEKARPFADGTMGIIAAHSMSLNDLKKTEDNLTHAMQVCRHLLALKKLLLREGE